MAEKLEMMLVEKPWGVKALPMPFAVLLDTPPLRPIGEIWFPIPVGRDMNLLVKYLFTSENLSIQVHPNDEQARARGFAGGKDECWYILDAEPDAVVGIGTTRALDGAELHSMAQSGDIAHHMTWYPAKKGMLFHIPAGTIHCIGAGVSLIELQQNIDVTYRLYDFGRTRDLHVQDGAAVARAEPFPAQHMQQVQWGTDQILLSNDHFTLAQIGGVGGSDGAGVNPARPWQRLGFGDADSRPPVGLQVTIIPVMGQVTANGVDVRAGECALIDADGDLRMEPDAHVLAAWPCA